jgi:hypothetical protein
MKYIIIYIISYLFLRKEIKQISSKFNHWKVGDYIEFKDRKYYVLKKKVQYKNKLYTVLESSHLNNYM